MLSTEKYSRLLSSLVNEDCFMHIKIVEEKGLCPFLCGSVFMQQDAAPLSPFGDGNRVFPLPGCVHAAASKQNRADTIMVFRECFGRI